jgi:hypothetical protein
VVRVFGGAQPSLLSCVFFLRRPGPPRRLLVLNRTRRPRRSRPANVSTGPWAAVPGATDVLGSGDVITLTDTNAASPTFYRVSVRMP